VQVAPRLIPGWPPVNPAGFQRLKPKHHDLLSNFVFSFNVRRYTGAAAAPAAIVRAAVAAAAAGGSGGWVDADPFFWEGEAEFLALAASGDLGRPTAPPPGPGDEEDFWFDESTMQ
jgi:hypothetical protein